MTFSLAIHGGAGALAPEKYTAQQISDAKEFLFTLLSQGSQKLIVGHSATEVAIDIVTKFENHELFNAGRGSVFNEEGFIEMDASFMSSSSQNSIDISAGLSGLQTIKNPILAAYSLAKEQGHALLSGKGAEKFCHEHKLETEIESYFKTEHRWQQHLTFLKDKQITLDHGNTVGVAVLDTHGEMVAATSTGGMNGKAVGRVSDSAIIGAGTWANSQTLAISGTGTGDHFIRLSLCRYIHDLMELKNVAFTEALVIGLDLLKEHGGNGGFAAVSSLGVASIPYNSGGMFRGLVSSEQPLCIGIWEELWSQ
ncbi:MAG: isoaspartyl peptidase/L-asparaginase [Bacteriovoracaceae bacterium]|nr:isoaspartyl peptidase/L-asparaginase [Bacteriovoracaceae bacterium]